MRIPVLTLLACAAFAIAAPYRSEARLDTRVAASGDLLVTQATTNRSPIRYDLYALRADGSHLELLTQDAANAAASRNGQEIAFTRDGAIWVMRRDGSGQTRVTTPPQGARDDDPAWVANAGTLYFSRATGDDFDESSTASIYSVRPDGSGLRRVTRAPSSSGLHNLPACEQMPSLSPNGKILVYTIIGSCSHSPDWWVDAATRAGRQVKFNPKWPDWATDVQFTGARWAPKRMEIAYTVWDPAFRAEISISDLSGKHTRRVVSWPTSFSSAWPGTMSPAWSPDGAWLAFVKPLRYLGGFTSTGRSAGELWLVGTSGVGLRRLTPLKEYVAATWLPPVSGG
jgi:Tol biopolymer transport system component